MKVNYFHNAKLLDNIITTLHENHDVLPDKKLTEVLTEKDFNNKEIADLFDNANSQLKGSNSSLPKDLIHSYYFLRPYFRDLECRGFSYQVLHSPSFINRFKSDIDIRLAMVANYDELYYPDKVINNLKKYSSVHIKSKYPLIAFSLGKSFTYEKCKCWLIIVLQSELAFNKSSNLREHFRGWRKVIFSYIINEAKKNGIERLYLVSSKDIMECCSPAHMKPKSVPESWIQIYDHTAVFFNLKMKKIGNELDIQLYARKKPIYKSIFYELII
jgi:hypothetical protein